jgi:hypothetical protein
MYLLSEEQVENVLERITKSGLSNRKLTDDLLDHFCCFMEEQIDIGKDFEAAFTEAYKAITPNGAQEIQEELFFLLTFKKQTNMKRIMYGSGFLAAFGISTGLMFKIMHWPGAQVTLLAGFIALIVSVVVLLINALRHIDKHSSAYNARLIIGVAAGFFIASGSIFKIFWMPGANIQMVLGMGIFSFIFLPMFFYQLYKKAIAAQ